MTDTPEPPDGEMSKLEYLKAQFFTAQIERKSAPMRTRRQRSADPTLRALGRFAKAMEAADPDARRAAIGWLADRFLGIRLNPPMR